MLNNRYKKSKKEDRTNMVIKTISKDLDIRDRWLGIRQLKQTYQPNPYARKTLDGKFIKQNERAQEAANYFSREQWGIKRKNEEDSETPPCKRSNIIQHCKNTTSEYNTEEITIEELKRIIKQIKRKKTPGPDEIPMELFRDMDDECLEAITTLLNQWWRQEDIPTETLKARVVLIYDKGDTGKYENYRPISLLSSLYNIFTVILQRRIANTYQD